MNDIAELPWSPADALATLQAMGDRPVVLAISAGDIITVSGRELHGLTLGTAAILAEAGVRRDTVVAIWAPNSAAWIAAGLACHYLGAVLAPVDALLSADQAAEQVVANGAALVLVDGEPPDAFAGKIDCHDLRAPPAAHEGPPAIVLAAENYDGTRSSDPRQRKGRPDRRTRPRLGRLAGARAGAVARPPLRSGAPRRLDRPRHQQRRHARALQPTGGRSGKPTRDRAGTHLSESRQRHGSIRRGGCSAARLAPTGGMGSDEAAPLQHPAAARLRPANPHISSR